MISTNMQVKRKIVACFMFQNLKIFKAVAIMQTEKKSFNSKAQ